MVHKLLDTNAGCHLKMGAKFLVALLQFLNDLVSVINSIAFHK